MSNRHKLIVVRTPTKEAMDKAKLVECESYNSVIERALKVLKENQ